MQKYLTAVLSEELVREASSVIAAEDTRGKLPAPYDKKLVNEILEDEMCVCGRPIESGSPEHEKIKALLENAGDQAVMSRVMSTSHALGAMGEKAQRAWSELARNQEDLGRINGEIQKLGADLTAISKELAQNPVGDIAEKETARARALQARRSASERISDIRSSMKLHERDVAAQQSALAELVKKSEAARRFVKRAQLAAALISRLEGRLKREEENARAAIENEISLITQKFMRKETSIRLDQNYQLRVYGEDGVELAKSTGENQLLGLAFTGAIAKYAKERQELCDDILLPGTVAPLVVDSPFGHLDQLYRRGVAEFLPNLATQVILLVSSSQASDVVIEGISGKLGDEYVLTRHNTTDGAGKASEAINIRGNSYDLTTYNSDIEGTRIQEVK
tara:strand:- start:469 stop:1653 length:1185 start_codon:yes stop_codon:yes gene_type:complete